MRELIFDLDELAGMPSAVHAPLGHEVSAFEDRLARLELCVSSLQSTVINLRCDLHDQQAQHDMYPLSSGTLKNHGTDPGSGSTLIPDQIERSIPYRAAVHEVMPVLSEVAKILDRYYPCQNMPPYRYDERLAEQLRRRLLRLIPDTASVPDDFRRVVRERESFRLARLDKLALRLSDIEQRARGFRCHSASQDHTFASLIVGGNEYLMSGLRGKEEFARHMKKWLEDGEEITVIDPYLFKRSRHKNKERKESDSQTKHLDEAYVDHLLDIFKHSSQRTVSFIYDGDPKGHLSRPILDKIGSNVKPANIKPRYFAAENVHDRVWLKRSANKWYARVIGTSFDGIGKRPTYVINMPESDVEEYLDYVRYLKSPPTLESRDFPIMREKTR